MNVRLQRLEEENQQLDITRRFERLWMSLAQWFKLYTYTAVFGLPNQRALQNQLQGILNRFYEALLFFFSSETARTFVNLIEQFIMSGVRLLYGISSYNQELVDSSFRQWYEEAQELSFFLGNLKEFWQAPIWNGFLNEYINALIEEIRILIEGNYEQEGAVSADLERAVTRLADYMAKGLIGSQVRG